MAYKVFTNGSVLNASEINDNLMNQSVMVFSNSTARSAALTSPVEGMVTYLEDTASYESYDGAAWIGFGGGVEPGLTFINSTSFSGVASQSVNNVFSSTYDSYKIVATIASSTADATLRMRMRVGGSDNSDNLYTFGNFFIGAFGAGAAGSTSNFTTTLFETGSFNTTNGGLIVIELARPFNAEVTKMTAISGGQSLIVTGGGLRNTTSYTGFSILASSGNMTGTVATYGYRKV